MNSDSMLAIDHAIVAVADPEAWAGTLRDRVGLVAVPGGRHEGTGTGNWIVPLGDSYLELMTVVDRTQAQQTALGQWVLDETRNGDRLVAVCLRTDALDEIAARIGEQPEAMSRRTGADEVLRWRLAGLAAAMSDERLPFFIEWENDARQHPGAAPVEHDTEADGISWIEYGGDRGRLAEWLGDHALPIRVVEEPPGPRTVAIATRDRVVRITMAGIA